MRRMPFEDGSFDGVVSSAAIHNIHPADGRTQAIGEAVRVLRPGGRLVVADINGTAAYAHERGRDCALRRDLPVQPGWL
jgi:ubiquinone/menaquinone biosynthesis C-methylase UbiE